MKWDSFLNFFSSANFRGRQETAIRRSTQKDKKTLWRNDQGCKKEVPSLQIGYNRWTKFAVFGRRHFYVFCSVVWCYYLWGFDGYEETGGERGSLSPWKFLIWFFCFRWQNPQFNWNIGNSRRYLHLRYSFCPSFRSASRYCWHHRSTTSLWWKFVFCKCPFQDLIVYLIVMAAELLLVLFQFCEANGIDYLGIRVYIGIWLGIIGLIVVCFEGSVFVKMFTRFTEEIFAALISLLYIVESLVKLFSVSH